MDNFRKSTSEEEIFRIFEEALNRKTEVILWQKVGLKRIMALAILKFINREEKTLLFKSLNNNAFNFNEEGPLQVKSDYRDIFFKGTIQLLRDNLLIVTIPREIQVLDLRERERKRIPLKGDHRLTLQKILGNIQGKTSLQQEWGLRILDITKGGASVEISSQDLNLNIKDWEEGTMVRITSMAAVELPFTLEGEIVYLAPLQISSHQGRVDSFRVGIKFSRQLPDTWLLMFHQDGGT